MSYSADATCFTILAIIVAAGTLTGVTNGVLGLATQTFANLDAGHDALIDGVEAAGTQMGTSYTNLMGSVVPD